jgi:hypothetical protein
MIAICWIPEKTEGDLWMASGIAGALGLAKNGLPQETLAHRGTTAAATTARSCEAGFKDGTARGWTLRDQREDRQARKRPPGTRRPDQ